MKKRTLKFIMSALLVTLGTGLLAGCGDTASSQEGNKNSSTVSGSITIAGSTAMQEFIEKSAKAFQDKNKDASISVQGGGSGTGLTQVSQGAVDIGDSDVFAEEKLEKDTAAKLKDHKVLVQGFALVTSSDVKVKSLKKDDIKKIFSGEIKNWKEVGGDDAAITVIHRPASSGTRATFVKTVLDGSKESENDKIGVTQDSTGSVINSLKSTKGAISYVAMASAKDMNKVAIDDVEPTAENIIAGKYKFWSYGHMYTNGEAKDLTKAFIEFVDSNDNKALFDELGFIQGSKVK
ncbi:MAG: phosphate ABC transporter substrate-binding protein [Inconstantimicrobium porci]|uniref:Phosphate-binding protein n=1 Tax=Inconstantimicrobium porci TaxID=2652291 RepID=A0A7X2MW63_9CLOT|nr:phosphate ABC transporter substrate-binding protein [Inconstantimicrobium porci]MDD6772191.1 phosphate ABC transporter substrate-binding protein [Inconstantimicrobium porci]MDY5913156.1 phosphate ABC transporter substrate-binding protein [Inconstantimicrobium porci]MSR90203.1 phosphate ABC transporter substrate-binding protein [Inconstantimicrobium porci]